LVNAWVFEHTEDHRVIELLVPTQPARIPSVVSMTHVAEVCAAADAFADWDARYGGGLIREGRGRAAALLLPLKVGEMIKLLEDDGWYLVRFRGSHRHYRHPTKLGTPP
jgi:hypothetical protein